MLRSEEVELLVCGNPSFDIDELSRVVIYDGYTADDDTIRYLYTSCVHSAALCSYHLACEHSTDARTLAAMSTTHWNCIVKSRTFRYVLLPLLPFFLFFFFFLPSLVN